MLDEGHGKQNQRDVVDPQPEAVDQHPESEREEDLLARPVEHAYPVVQAVEAAPYEGFAFGRDRVELSLVQVWKAHNREARDEGHPSQDEEGRPVGEPSIPEHDEHQEQGGKRPRLANGRHASHDRPAPRRGGQAHGQGRLGLEYGMHAEAGYEHPGDNAPEAAGEREETESHGHDDDGPGGQALQRDAVEERRQEHDEEAADFADGRDVSELRTIEVEHVVEVVGQNVGVGVEGEAQRGRHDRQHDEAAAGRGSPHLAHAGFSPLLLPGNRRPRGPGPHGGRRIVSHRRAVSIRVVDNGRLSA